MSEQDAMERRKTEGGLEEEERGEGVEGYREKDEEVEEKVKEEEVKEEEEEKEEKENRPRWPPREDVLPDIEMAMKSRIRSAARKLMEDFEIEGEGYEKQIMNSIAKGMSREGIKVFQSKKKLLLRSMGRGSFFAEEDRFYESSEDESSAASEVSEESIDFFEDVEERTNTSEKPERVEEFTGEEWNTEEREVCLSPTSTKEASENPERSELTKVSEEPPGITESTVNDSANEQPIKWDEVKADGPRGGSSEGEEESREDVSLKNLDQEHELYTDKTEELNTLEHMVGEEMGEEGMIEEECQRRRKRLDERTSEGGVDEESTVYPETTTRSTSIRPNREVEEAAAEHLARVGTTRRSFKYPDRADASPRDASSTSASSFGDKYSSSCDKKKKEKRRISWITLVCSGQTSREELGYSSGWTEHGDDEMSAGGRAATETAGKELLRRGSKFDMVITSTLAVDREATNLLLYSVGQDSIRRYTTWELNPRHLGDLEGTTEAGTASRWGWLSGEVWTHLGPPRMAETHPDWYRQAEGRRQTGESVLHLQARTKRVWEFTEKVLRKGKRSVLVVCRKPVTCALLLHALGLQPTDLSEWSPSPAVPLLFSFELKGPDMGLAAVEMLTEDTKPHCVCLFRAMLERYVDFGILDKYGMAELKRRYEKGRKLPTIDDIYRYKRAEAHRLFESCAGEVGQRHRLLARLADFWRPGGATLAERVYQRIEKEAPRD